MNQSKPTGHPVPIVTTSQIWKMSLTTAKENRPKLFALVALGFLLPQFLGFLGLSLFGEQKVQLLKEFTDKAETGHQGTLYPIYDLLMSFMGPAFTVWILAGLLFIATYLAIVELNYQFQTGREVDTVGNLFIRGLKSTFPGGIALAFLLPVLFFIGQLLILPGLIVAVMGLLAPALLVIEKKGGIKSIFLALTSKVSKLSRSQPIQVFFALSGIAAIFYTGLLLKVFLASFINNFDLYLSTSRSFFLINLFGSSLTLSQTLLEIVDLIILGILLVILPLGGSSCYLLLKRPAKEWTIV